MRYRVKNTLDIGEVTNISGSVDNPLIELTMKDGSQMYYKQSELTDKPPFGYIWNLLDKIKQRLTP